MEQLRAALRRGGRGAALWLSGLILLPAAPGAASGLERDGHRLDARAASAAVLRWPSRRVTYRDYSGYGQAVETAVRWINGLPSPLRLVAAPPGKRPQVRIYRARAPHASWAGLGWYPPNGRVKLNSVYLDRDYVTPTDRAQTAAHELLHAVGVPHLKGCALMHWNNGLASPRCQRGLPTGVFRCGPQPRDLRTVVRLYGGRLGGFQGYTCRTRATFPEPGEGGQGPAGPTIDPGIPPSENPPSPDIQPVHLALDESWEYGAAAWDTGAGWAPTRAAISGTWSVTDSPSGSYSDDTTDILRLRTPIDLSEDSSCVLSMWAIWDLEPGFDVLGVELLDAQGWQTVGTLTGWASGTVLYETTIDTYAGHAEPVGLRFVLRTDSSITGDGVTIDDIRIECT